MKQYIRIVVVAYLALFAVSFLSTAKAQSLQEYGYIELRYCGEPRRGTLGEILRDKEAIRRFRQIHPCPSTGKTTGACNGWAIDHVIPLACGGCDSISNMQWLPDKMKNYAGEIAKDRWERYVYANDGPTGGKACKRKAIQ